MAAQLYRTFPILAPEYHPFKSFDRLQGKKCLVLRILSDQLQAGAVGLADFKPSLAQSRQTELALHCLLQLLNDLRHQMENVRNVVIPIVERVPHVNHYASTVCYRLWLFYDPESWHPGERFAELISKNMDCKKSQGKRNHSAMHQPQQGGAKRSQTAVGANKLRASELIDLTTYIAMCTSITQTVYEGLPATRRLGIQDPGNPVNPVYIFSKQFAVFVPKADPRFINLFNYGALESVAAAAARRPYGEAQPCHHMFPDPQCVYQLTLDQMAPTYFLSLNVPELRPTFIGGSTLQERKQLESEEQRVFRTLQESDPLRNVHLIPRDSPEFKNAEMLMRERLRAMPWTVNLGDHTYEYVVGQQLESTTVLSLDAIAESNRRQKQGILAKIAEMRKQPGMDEKTLAKEESRLRKEFEAKAIESFRTVWHEHVSPSIMSNALREIIKWGNNYQKTHTNLCSTQPKFTTNMSLSSEWAIRLLWHAETIHYCYVGHEMVLVAMISQLGTYGNDRTNKFLYLALGPPGLAKSYTLNITYDFAIPGSVDRAMTESKLSDTAAQCLDYIIKHWHELDDARLGVKPGNGNGKQNGPVDDITNHFKSRISEGWVMHKYMNLDRLTGERTEVNVKISANCGTLANSNSRRDMINPAIADRFHIVTFLDYDRPDKTLQQCTEAARCASPAIQKLQLNNQAQMHLMQYRVALTGFLMRLEVLPPVNTIWAEKIFDSVIRRILFVTGQRKLPNRLTNRMVAAVRSLTIINAIYILFDSQVSPLRDKPFELQHMSLLVPYLMATEQEAILVLGIFKSELENRFQTTLIKALLDEYFPPTPIVVSNSSVAANVAQAATTGCLDSKDYKPADAARAADYICHKNVFADPSASSHKHAGDEHWSRVRNVTRRIIERMNPRPDETTLQRAVNQLTTNVIPGTTSAPILVLGKNDSHLYLARQIVSNLRDDVVEQAIRDCMRHPYIQGTRRYAFNCAKITSTPYLFTCIDLTATDHKDSNSKPLTIRSANYLDARQSIVTKAVNRLPDGSPALPQFDTAFDRAEHMEITCDPAEMYWYQHLGQQYWTGEDLKEWNLHSREVMDQLALQAATESKIPDIPPPRKYPEEFVLYRGTSDFVSAIEQEKKSETTGRFYSTNLQRQHWLERQGLDVANSS